MKKLVYLFGLFLVLAVVACNTDTKKDDTDNEEANAEAAAELIETQSNALVDFNFDFEDIVSEYDLAYIYLYEEDIDEVETLYADLMMDLEDMLAEVEAVEVEEDLADAKTLLLEEMNEVINYFYDNGVRMVELQKLYVTGEYSDEEYDELDEVDSYISDIAYSLDFDFEDMMYDVLSDYDLEEDVEVYYQD